MNIGLSKNPFFWTAQGSHYQSARIELPPQLAFYFDWRRQGKEIGFFNIF